MPTLPFNLLTSMSNVSENKWVIKKGCFPIETTINYAEIKTEH